MRRKAIERLIDIISNSQDIEKRDIEWSLSVLREEYERVTRAVRKLNQLKK